MPKIYIKAFFVFIAGLIFFYLLSMIATPTVGVLSIAPYLSAILYIYINIILDKIKKDSDK